MGQKTSVYLTDALRDRRDAEAPGVSLADLIEAGLDARAGTGVRQDAVLGRLETVTGRLEALLGAAAAPGARSPAGGGDERPAAGTRRPAAGSRAVPKSRARAAGVDAATAALASGDIAGAARKLRSVTSGTAVFREPGADPVVTSPVPDGRSSKRGQR